MRRTTTTALLSLAALALTGCGPSTLTVESMIPAGGVRFDDAGALRRAVVEAGASCPGEQVVRDTGGGTDSTVLACDQDLLLGVADSERMEQQMIEGLEGIDGIHYLVQGNWVAASQDRARLEEIREDLGGEIASTSR